MFPLSLATFSTYTTSKCSSNRKRGHECDLNSFTDPKGSGSPFVSIIDPSRPDAPRDSESETGTLEPQLILSIQVEHPPPLIRGNPGPRCP